MPYTKAASCMSALTAFALASLGHVAIAVGELPIGEQAPQLGKRYVLSEDAPLRTQPGAGEKRGLLPRGAWVTPFAFAQAPNCNAAWWLVGPDAWMCPSESTVSSGRPHPAAARTSNDVIEYGVVGSHGALGYLRREEIDSASPQAEMQPGFMLGFTQSVTASDDAAFLTTHGFWVPARDVQMLVPSRFQGVPIESELDVGWVFVKRAQLYSSPEVKRAPQEFLDRLTPIRILGEQDRRSTTWLKSESGWLRSSDVRVPRLQTPPQGLADGERWLDVDIATQTLVAYEGPRPVYATLVSTGRGKPGSKQATPVGEYRIWVKLLHSDMDNLEDPDAETNYAVQAVPYVMFFQGGYGLHGTYWHEDFGQTKSHGCVNLSVADARWLFQFTSPFLPKDWSAAFPGAREPGTLVRVH